MRVTPYIRFSSRRQGVTPPLKQRSTEWPKPVDYASSSIQRDQSPGLTHWWRMSSVLRRQAGWVHPSDLV